MPPKRPAAPRSPATAAAPAPPPPPDERHATPSSAVSRPSSPTSSTAAAPATRAKRVKTDKAGASIAGGGGGGGAKGKERGGKEKAVEKSANGSSTSTTTTTTATFSTAASGREKSSTGSAAAKKDDKKDKEGKEKAVTGAEAERVIFAYLTEQNRPYSATEVSANLHGKVTKTVADKVLRELASAGTIMGKGTNKNEKGSQWVFWPVQTSAPSPTEEAEAEGGTNPSQPTTLADLEARTTTLKESTLPALKTRLRQATSQLHTLRATPSTASLTTQLRDLHAARAEKTARLAALRSGSVRAVSTADVDALARASTYWAKRARNRRAAFREIEAMVLDALGGGAGGGGLVAARTELRECIGMEEEEA